MKISPKSILEEGQTNRECHVKQAVPNSKARECHAKKSGQEDRKTARPSRTKWHGSGTTMPLVQPWHGRTTCAAMARSDRTKWHGHATAVLMRDGFKTRDFVLV